MSDDQFDFSKFNMESIMDVQKKMQEAQKALAEKIVIGEAAAGQVKAHMNGRYYVIKIEISDEMHKNDKQVLEDLIAAAINNAVRKIEKESQETAGKLATDLNLPTNLDDLIDKG